MNYSDKTIFVSGVTGKQGGAVARKLLDDGWKVRGLTRNPESPQAREMKRFGVEITLGDLEDRESLDSALKGIYGVFSVQTPYEAGVEAEIRQGLNLAAAAKVAQVSHFIYSSVGGAERGTGVPHFESKWQIEDFCRNLPLPLTIFRPVFFMENFYAMLPEDPEDEKQIFISAPLPADKPLQMIAVRDIGFFTALALENSGQYLKRAMEIAGDELTMPQVARILSDHLGQEVDYREIPLEKVHEKSEDTAKMYDWFNREGYRADIKALRTLHPGLLNFADWLDQIGSQELAKTIGIRA